MAIDWKALVPFLSVLVTIAILKWSNISLTSGLIGGIVVVAIWLTIIPLLNSIGVRAADSWFVRASIFALIAASCSLIPMILKDAIAGGIWISYIVDSAMTLSWLFAFIGGIVALMNTK